MEAWQANACSLLQSQGVGTLVARTGREAMGLIEESALGSGPRIHVAVLDQRLPVMGGLQILRRLQQDLEDLASRERLEKVQHPAAQQIPPTILLAGVSCRAG
jgi:CheY-like chemotaxis protein